MSQISPQPNPIKFRPPHKDNPWGQPLKLVAIPGGLFLAVSFLLFQLYFQLLYSCLLLSWHSNLHNLLLSWHSNFFIIIDYQNPHCFLFIWLLLGHAAWLVECWFSNQRSNPGPQQWKHPVLTTGLPGKSWIPTVFDSILRFTTLYFK